MRPFEALEANRDSIRRLAARCHVTNVRVFGSAVRGDDVEGSDLDLLVDPTAETTLFHIGALKAGLETLLRIHVDVLTPDSLPDKFRDRVLEEAQPL